MCSHFASLDVMEYWNARTGVLVLEYFLGPKSNATFYIFKHDLECLLSLSSW